MTNSSLSGRHTESMRQAHKSRAGKQRRGIKGVFINSMLSVNGKEYTILRLFGKGKGGYSYLAQIGKEYVVVKQIHHEPCSYYQFGNKIEAEVGDYKRLKSIGISMPEILDVDAANERIVKEYISGDAVYELALKDKSPEICLRQIKDMRSRLYKANANIDYFPTNFILQNGTLY